METHSWQRVKEIFQEALEKPHAERRAYVAGASAGDERLRSEVEALLAADGEADRFLASPTLGDAAGLQRVRSSDVLARLRSALAGRFWLERELGRGGMGIVFLARDVALDRPVAIKLLPPELAAQPDYRTRFLREARTAAGLSHPNIVPIHLVEEEDGLVYFVMTFVDGESLGDRVRRAGPLKPAEAAKLVQEVAWALAYAHSHGVVHRDIKPDNILIDKGSGRAMVTDFGIARVASAETLSQEGALLGTLRYMSPEQAGAAPVIDGRSDLYSLGVTAFFALTGRLPFDSDSAVQLLAMHLTEPAPPVLTVSRGIPARFAKAVDRCLAKDPAARYDSGEALAEAIAEAQATGREIAPSVRELLGGARSAVLLVGGLVLLWLWIATWANNLEPLVVQTITGPIFWVLAATVGLVAIRPIFAARGVLRAGSDERDVAEAAAYSVLSRDANVEHTLKQAEQLRRLFRTPLARGAFVVLAAFCLFALWYFYRSWTRELSVRMLLAYMSYASSILILLFWGFPAALCLGMAWSPDYVIGLFSGGPERADLLRKLWAGPLGRGLFRIAGIGLARSKAAAVPDSSPTEVLMGRAAHEVFEQLPKDQRARLGDVGSVIGALERAAGGLRVRRDEIVRALGDAGPPGRSARREGLVAELETVRTRIQGRLGAAVGALETLRLDLLRLRAGVGQPDDVTASIEEARSIGEAVSRELEAHREAESLS